MPARGRPLEVATLIDTAYHGINQAVAGGLAAAGHPQIRPAHAVVFELLTDHSHVSQLARDAGMTKQAMAELVGHLERHGYVKRASNPNDRRTSLVELTDRGRQAAKDAGLVLDSILRAWEVELGPRQLADLRRGLTRLVDATPTDAASAGPALGGGEPETRANPRDRSSST